MKKYSGRLLALVILSLVSSVGARADEARDDLHNLAVEAKENCAVSFPVPYGIGKNIACETGVVRLETHIQRICGSEGYRQARLGRPNSCMQDAKDDASAECDGQDRYFGEKGRTAACKQGVNALFYKIKYSYFRD